MSTKTQEFEARVSDIASLEMLKKAELDCIDSCFTRYETQKNQCGFGKTGVCCKICHFGPCRITAKAPKGICGATADTIAARNFLREVAAGTATHSDHGRHLVLKLKEIAEGKGGDFQIKDEEALRRTARMYGLEEEGREQNAVALDLANLFIGEFTSQEEHLKTLQLAPVKRQGVWKKMGVEPYGVDRMVAESLHRTHMGVDHDYKNLLLHAFRTALSNGWGGSRISSLCSDILFGTPTPLKSTVNLGVLRKDTVNIVVHGHEPSLSELLTVAVADPEVLAYAKEAGADGGITLAGICCTANEILMRHGVPIAGNMLQQELAIVTGAVEAMIIDVQCCMPSLPEVASKYHTEVISTQEMAKTEGATQAVLSEETPLDSAKDIVRRAIDNFKNRDPERVQIPTEKEPLVAGFSVEAIKYMLGGKYRKSFRPLNDGIIQNRIFGVVGIVGCNNPKQKSDEYNNVLVKELLKNNVLVVQTGCMAIGSAKAGYLRPEVAKEMCGQGLWEICETVGIPPVLHVGSCVDNTRILEAVVEIVAEGGLGDDMSAVPAVGVAPEWMSEKAISIGTYFVGSGIDVVLGNPFYISGSEKVSNYLNGGCKEDFGASFHTIEDPMEAAKKILSILNERREKLNINKKAERKLLDMKDRREL